MKFHTETKIIFWILGLLIVFALVVVAVNYDKIKAHPAQSQLQESVDQTGKTCAPDSSCETNPVLCMELNKNKVCN